MRTHTLHKQKPLSAVDQLQSIRDTVALGNGGFADFPKIHPLFHARLVFEGYTLHQSSQVYFGGVRVYSPAYSPEAPIPAPVKPSAPDLSGDVEGAILSRQSYLISTL